MSAHSRYLKKWHLVPDGEWISTPEAHLLPVRSGGEPAMLRLPLVKASHTGGALLAWWDGEGAARVLAREPGAMLLERATGSASLAAMSRTGKDDEACRILCAVAARLHAPRERPLPPLIPLVRWFEPLGPAASTHGGMLLRCAAAAKDLLDNPRQTAALHGDLHHGNVLDFADRGWLAIDPKGLIGELAFDYANIFTNPDLADPGHPIATDPERFAQRLRIVTEAARLERQRLLQWILAWTGLSASWFLAESNPLAAIALRVVELAACELDR